MQGISFKLREFKYKGSEVDRKFSIGNLQKIIRQLQSDQALKQTNATTTRLLSKKISPEIKQGTRTKNIADLLMNPEFSNEQLPHQWRLEKKHKKKSRGKHL